MNDEEKQRMAKETWDGVEGEELFFSLMHPKGVAKMRKCIKCRQEFRSSSAGRRICVKCKSAKNTRVNSDFFIRGDSKWS